MSQSQPLTILCLAGYEKGYDFIVECKRQGCRVILLTVPKLAGANWPRESIDETFYIPDMTNKEDVIKGVSYLARTQAIDRIVALDDYDVEIAAALREHLRVPGMGDTTARYFRDKLAMRAKARDSGILVPDFVPVLNYDRIRQYMERVPPPWVLKPRSEAAAVGIKKVNRAEDLWPILDELGDRQSFHVLEKYVPGDIFHVDSIVSEREVVFAAVHKYGHPPMDVAHHGGIFTTRRLSRQSGDAQALEMLNRELLASLGFVRGVTHTEFIKGQEDGRFYFLETAARVGGANIVELVEAATGINLWAEWAKVEIAGGERPYQVPEHRDDYAGIIISLARQEWPDTSAYNDPEIVWRLKKRHHVGLIVTSQDPARVEQLLEQYIRRFYEDFHATAPLPDKPIA
ncbi:MAG TPA: ATP-grasp domain-containing protein [Blastocatellia bacterium]|nr:ATP-grasp domain-containing protein [Blastocatellia bacterium]